MTEPIDIESLDPLYRDVFRDPANGAPDDISKAGCLALAKLGKDAWNAWRLRYPTRKAKNLTKFKNFADFSAQDFRRAPISFTDFQFDDGANFAGALFSSSRHASFVRANFGVNANFDNAHFYDCWFSSAKFGSQASFRRVSFEGAVSFTDVVFYSCNFDYTTFKKICLFLTVTFKGSVYFRNANFYEEVNFQKGKTNKLLFDESVFHKDCDFLNWTFNSATSFSKVNFKLVPKFHGCYLHQDTSFVDAVFPKSTGQLVASSAYRTLKLAFSQQQAIREEQRFFKLEMAEEAARATGMQRFLYKAYSLCSDYGFSVGRPLALLGLSLLAFAGVYGFFSWVNHCYGNQAACQFNSAWIEFSLLQALPLPGLDKLSDALRVQLFPVSGWISILVTLAVILHKTTSIAALFLAGLALRNLFKLK